MKKIIGTVPFVNSYPLTFYINDIDSNISLKYFYPSLGRRFSLEALEGLFREALGSPPRFLVAEGYVLALWDKG